MAVVAAAAAAEEGEAADTAVVVALVSIGFLGNDPLSPVRKSCISIPEVVVVHPERWSDSKRVERRLDTDYGKLCQTAVLPLGSMKAKGASEL